MPGGVEPSNLEKVFWPESGLTKGDLLDYFDAVADVILPALRDRPLTVKRYPDGIDGFSFFQKNTPKYAPDWVKTVPLWADSARRDVHYALCNSKRTLMWLANQAAIELHPWLSRTGRLDQPDHLVFDLDPSPGQFHVAVEVALTMKEVLDQHGIEGVVKTSGAKGIHVYIPIQRRFDYRAAREAAVNLAHEVEGQMPDVVTSEVRLAKRGGRLFLDIGRNAPGAHIVAPYSPRARSGATISFPIMWDKVPTARPEAFTIRTVPKIR
ncbi:MAG: non-homologous end-joining DNA ligase [Actinomycetota bacterium]|nr:non-homologous end-joining DNA ligase [Actinomycetota bacterium]